MSKFDDKTTAEEAAKFYSSQIKDKVVLVTGASPGGLGAEACCALAQNGAALVILAGRSEEKLFTLQATIKKESPEAKTRLLLIDQASFASVREAAKAINSYAEPIDVLINGAAVMMGPYSTTADGFESQFAVNHLSHFLLTNLIKPQLAKSKSPRVVSVSSAGHRFSDIRWDDVGFSGGEKYEKGQSYGQSKTANMLFSIALANHWKDLDLTTVSLHPGRIQTNLARSMTKEELEKKFGFVIDENGKWTHPTAPLKTISQGAATYVVAAFNPDLKEHNGSYMVDCQVDNKAAHSYAIDPTSAERLWKLSEKMVGQEFP